MQTSSLVLRISTMVLPLLLAASGSHAAQPMAVDIIYSGGNIITVNELQPDAEAVAVRVAGLRPLAIATR